jgi:outer membrane cobalamin receptor
MGGASLLTTGAAFSQAKDTTHLREVRVDAKRIPAAIQPINAMQLLTGEQLQRLNSLSVADAVRYFSGVQLKDYGGIGGLKTINVRSMGTNHTAVSYDGLLIGNAQNGQVDLGKFSLDNIESIALYNGQQNTILQPARAFAAGNVLALRSRTPQFAEGERWHGKASVKTGSSGLINPSLLWQQKIGEQVYSTVSAEWINANGRYKFRYTNGVYDTTAVRQNGNVNAFRAEAGLNGTLADSSSWAVKYYIYTSGRGLPGAIVANHFNYGQHLEDRDQFVQASYRKNFGQRYSLVANAKYTDLYSRYIDPEYPNEQHLLDNFYHQKETYLSLASQYRIRPWWESSLAADLTVNTMDANLYRFPYPTRYTTLLALASRAHFSRLEIQGNVLATIVDESVKAYQGAGAKREFTPALSIAWQPLARKDLWLRGFYKNIFRMPTFNDLYYTFIGNHNLAPEYVKQYDAGFTYRQALRGNWQYITLQADGYYNRVKDKIVAVPSDNLFGWSMMNLGRVEIKGLDAVVRSAWQPLSSLLLTVGLNYTWQQAQDVTEGKGGYNYGQQIPYTPRHSGSFTAGVDWRAFSLNYSFIYTGERYSQKRNIPVNYVQPWYTSDMSITWACKASRHTSKIQLEINNLLNQYYDVVLNFPMPGRNYRITWSISR